MLNQFYLTFYKLDTVIEQKENIDEFSIGSHLQKRNEIFKKKGKK